MVIQTSTFFAIVGALAAGGAGGYYASQKRILAEPAATPVDAPRASAAAIGAPPVVETSSAAATPSVAPAPICDDALGSPGTCPPPGYSAEEGGCGAVPTKRCGDFKLTMKPKVAERAVECLNALKVGERCDPARLALCGHLALMRACPEASDDASAIATPGSVTAICKAIVQGCEGTTLGPTIRECRATLAGMSELGRTNMATCMKSHCSDKGLLGCEGMVDVK
jgi:hypothetical protein